MMPRRSPSTAEENPLLHPSPLPLQTPDFGAIREDHFLPAFERGMAEHLAEVRAVAASDEPPTVANTLEPLERAGPLLERTERAFSALTAAHTTPGLQAIEEELAPRLAAHRDDILMNPALLARLEAMVEAESRGTLVLSEEDARLLEHHHAAAVRAGARLEASDQATVRAINEELSVLSARFRRNLLALRREGSVVVEREAELAGLEASAVRSAADEARRRGLQGRWVLTLTNTTRQPALAHLRDRALRKRLWTASAHRGLGRNGGTDNRPLVTRMASLRAERARILGYPNWAAYVLDRQMAATPEAVVTMLSDLLPPVLTRTRQEAADIEARLRADGIAGPLEPWDWEYYAQQVRKEKYALDAEELRPYLELEQVLQEGVFRTMRDLFGITFQERYDLPVYHEEVRVFDVLESDGETVGLFYLDPYSRDSKRGGAWMSTFVPQSHLLGQRPVIVNVLNLTRPAPGEPVLLTLDEVTTLFHEMGHALHGLFSDVTYPSLSGTAVPRDFVEFPSTFQEDWVVHPEVLGRYARHHATGAPMPDALKERIVAAQRFNQGFETLEYLAAALVDLSWHLLGPDEIPDDVEAFEAEVLARHGAGLPAVPPRYRSSYFSHAFPGGYSARYYAYIWSEVLAADAFRFVQTRGGLTRNNGDRLRGTALSRGNSRDPMAIFMDFRDAPPDPQALLARRGLTGAD